MNPLVRLNHDVFDAINAFARHTGWLHQPMIAYAKYGVLLFGLLLIIAVLRSRTGTARDLAAAVWAGAAVLLAVAVNQPIVQAVAEARPYAGHPGVHVLIARSTDPSFPSDHATMAGAAAAGLLIASRKLGLIASIAAALMAFARVYVGAHYPGDVLAGLALGAAVAVLGWLVLRAPITRAATWLRAQPGVGRLLVVDRAGSEAVPE